MLVWPSNNVCDVTLNIKLEVDVDPNLEHNKVLIHFHLLEIIVFGKTIF